MANINGTNYVRWSVFILVISFAVTILGFIWQRLEGINEDITQIKVDAATTRADVNNLLRRIGNGEITFKLNGK